jgi:hypothetical protein
LKGFGEHYHLFCHRKIRAVWGDPGAVDPADPVGTTNGLYSLNDRVTLHTAWIDWSVDTQDLHFLLPRPPLVQHGSAAMPKPKTALAATDDLAS